MIETKKTKTFTLGAPYIKEMVNDLNDFLKVLKQDPEWEWNNLRQIQRIDSYINFLKTIPWNEGGYCEDEL